MSQIARFMGPAWGLPGADRTQVGPMFAPWTLLSGVICDIQLPSWREWSGSSHLHHISHYYILNFIESVIQQKVRYKQDIHLLVLLIFWLYTQERKHFVINLILIATNCCKSASLFEAMGCRICIKTAQIQWIVGTLFHIINVLLASMTCQNIISHLSYALLCLSSSDVNWRSQQRSTMEIFLTSLSRKSMSFCLVDYS